MSMIEKRMIHKYYSKLYIISEAFGSNDTSVIENIYVSHICWFITKDGENVHKDIKNFMSRLENIVESI